MFVELHGHRHPSDAVELRLEVLVRSVRANGGPLVGLGAGLVASSLVLGLYRERLCENLLLRDQRVEVLFLELRSRLG